jgi:hypothetical protein
MCLSSALLQHSALLYVRLITLHILELYTDNCATLGLMRRAGNTDGIARFLTLAERGDPRSNAHAGLQYCKGLYYRYTSTTVQIHRLSLCVSATVLLC